MPYIINFQFAGLTQGAAQAKQAAQAFQQLQASTKAIRSRSGGTGGTGGAARSAQPRGPWNNLLQAQQKYATALTAGNPVNTFDAYINMLKKQATLQRVMTQATGNGNRFGKAMGNMIMSSRLGIGAGGVSAMPLVSKLIPALAELGPAGIAAAAGVALLTVEIALMMKQMEYAISFANAQLQGGGSAGQTGRLIGAGAALGMSPQQMAQAANQYNQSLQNNPYAAARASQKGYTPNYVGPFGDTNDTKRFLKGLEDFMHERNDHAARAMSMGTPLEGMGWVRNLSEKSKQEVLHDQAFNQSPEQLRAAAEAQKSLNETLALLQQSLNKLAPDLKIMAQALSALIDLLHPKDAAAGLSPAWEFQKWFDKKFHPDQYKKDLEREGGINAQKDQQDRESRDRHTEAMNNHARALDQATHTFGSSPSADKAFPHRGYLQPHEANATRRQLGMGQLPVG